MWQTLRKEEVLRQLDTDEKQGLTEKEVKERKEKYRNFNKQYIILGKERWKIRLCRQK